MTAGQGKWLQREGDPGTQETLELALAGKTLGSLNL